MDELEFKEVETFHKTGSTNARMKTVDIDERSKVGWPLSSQPSIEGVSEHDQRQL